MTTLLNSQVDGCSSRYAASRTLKYAGGIILLASAHLSGCSGSVTGPSWALVKEQTACEALDPRYCVGSSGFAVRHDGGFLVGPAGNGVTLAGQLDGGELAQIGSDAGALASSSLGGTPECDPGHTIPGSGLNIELTLENQTTVEVVANLCYHGGRDRALKLRDDLGVLMQKYYPRPFPP